MEDKKLMFDDRELEEEEYITPEELKPLVNEQEQKEIEKEIDEILKEISTQK